MTIEPSQYDWSRTFVSFLQTNDNIPVEMNINFCLGRRMIVQIDLYFNHNDVYVEYFDTVVPAFVFSLTDQNHTPDVKLDKGVNL